MKKLNKKQEEQIKNISNLESIEEVEFWIKLCNNKKDPIFDIKERALITRRRELKLKELGI
jgi:uncharacterized protein YciU (UPF0263 family)